MEDPQHPAAASPAGDFEEDPRYAVSQRELWLAVAYWILFTVAVTGSAFLIGGNEPVGELTFVFGFPAWFFWSAIVCSLAFSVVPWFIVRNWFTDVPLTADGRPEPAPEAQRQGQG